MKISWLTKFSLIDYPWKVSCVIFTPWCNMRCKFCHNPEFVLPEEILKNNFYINKEDFLEFLDTRHWLIDWVSICGWEPTLQKWLKSFCKKIKDKWFLVKLDTNWRDPNLIKELIEDKLVDYIAMDIKTSLKKYEIITWVSEDYKNYLKSIDIIKKSDIEHEFRTTVIKWFHKLKDIKDIWKLLAWAKNYYFQNYKPWKILDKDFIWNSFKLEELELFSKCINSNIKNIWIRI